MKDAAPRQLEVLAFVHGYRQQHDFAPSRKEIAVGIGLASPAGISQHLEALERKGFVHCLPGKQRAISLTDAGLRLVARHRAQRIPPGQRAHCSDHLAWHSDCARCAEQELGT